MTQAHFSLEEDARRNMEHQFDGNLGQTHDSSLVYENNTAARSLLADGREARARKMQPASSASQGALAQVYAQAQSNSRSPTSQKSQLAYAYGQNKAPKFAPDKFIQRRGNQNYQLMESIQSRNSHSQLIHRTADVDEKIPMSHHEETII